MSFKRDLEFGNKYEQELKYMPFSDEFYDSDIRKFTRISFRKNFLKNLKTDTIDITTADQLILLEDGIIKTFSKSIKDMPVNSMTFSSIPTTTPWSN